MLMYENITKTSGRAQLHTKSWIMDEAEWQWITAKKHSTFTDIPHDLGRQITRLLLRLLHK